VAAAAVVLVACGRPGPAVPFANTQPTMDAVVAAVVRALEQRDQAGLERLALTEAEFHKNVWPALPASQPEVGMPADYVWADTRFKSRAELARTLRDYGGRHYVVEEVRVRGERTAYRGFTVHRQTEITLRDLAGERHRVRLFGSLVETATGWKVFSYVVD
jgi:hypothetical protein